MTRCFAYINGITSRTSKFIYYTRAKRFVHTILNLNTSLRSCIVYKFTCAGCNSVYIGETSRHLSTRVREHLFTDKNSHSFKHLKTSTPCKNLCSENCFKVLDSASNYHNLKIKEALHIMWERPSLNKQLQHYNISLSF